MTAFVPTDIPSSIDTLEELAVWSLTILNELYPAVTVQETAARVSHVVSCAPFFLDAATPSGWYAIARASFPMAPTWRQSGRPWAHVQEIGSLPIPAGYK